MRSLLLRSIAVLGILLLFAGIGLAKPHTETVPNPNQVASSKPLMPEGTRLNYISESFEDGVPPAGWTVMTSGASTTWEQTNAAANSGAFSAAVFYGDQGAFQDEWLVTPALDVSGAGGLWLEFFEQETYWADYGLRHTILVSYTVPNDPAAFTPLITWTPSNHTIPAAFGDPVLLDLSSEAGQSTLYLAFRYEGDWADDWLIDDVRIYEPSAHDVAAIDALPGGNQPAGASLTPQAVVKNVGLNTESFDVRYEIEDNGAVVYSELMNVGGLASDATATVDFPGFIPVEGLWYDTRVTTLLGGDEDPSNDVFMAGFNTYPLGHVPMMFLFTNSGCGPCVPANQAMDAYMPGQGNDVALVRIHTWWPNPGDIMYTYNTPQCDAYVGEYNVSGVPDMWLDGTTGLGFDGPAAVTAFDAAKYNASPMTVTPVYYDELAEQLTVEINITANLPDSDYRLVCMYTEDNIEHSGGNGEPIHMQAFRYAYPDGLEGTPIGTATGYHSYVIDMPLDPNDGGDWVFENLRATCYVQDRGNAEFRKILESGTNFLSNLTDVTPVAVSVFNAIGGAGSAQINWESASDDVEFRLLRMDGATGVEVTFESTGLGSYAATDHVAEGTYEYQLHGRQGGEDFAMMRSENVVVSPAVLANRIMNNYPNPFNPTTTISLSLKQSGLIKVSVYDMQGRRVADLFEGTKAAGEHVVSWDAQGVGSGIYLVRMIGDGFSDSRKVVLAK